MSWFRVDDKSAFHRKVLRAGNEGWGAFCRAGAMSAGEGTDGRVTLETCLAIAPAKVWARVVDAGLAERIEGSTDLLLHDYLQWNPSAAQVAASIEAKRRAGSKGGNRKAGNHSSGLAAATAPATAHAIAPAQQSPSIIPTQPNPTNLEIPDREAPPVADAPPKVEPVKAKRRKASSAMPEPGEVPQWLAAQGIPALDDPEWGAEVAKFLDHHRARDTRFAVWSAGWGTWKRNAEAWGTKAPSQGTSLRKGFAAPDIRMRAPDVQRSPGYQPIEEAKRAAFNAECEARAAREREANGTSPEEIPF